MKARMAFLVILGLFVSQTQAFSQQPVKPANKSEELVDVQVPIAFRNRVRNKTGIQCVWSSLETLGRHSNEKKLYLLTDYHHGMGSPWMVPDVLNNLGVQFEQTFSTSDRRLLVKGCQRERLGVLFGVRSKHPAGFRLKHAMVLVHYDEEKNVTKFIDNADPELKIQTWTLEKFNQFWDGWCVLVYPDSKSRKEDK